MLDVKRLRILREVAKQESFSGAADELYLSQSAVSQQVATLEKEVGMTLLERTREGPKLTEAGRVLVNHANAAIARLEEAERDLAMLAGLEGGEVRIASFPSASATLLTSAVSDFVARYPKVRVSVSEAEPEDSVPRLRAGEFDIALTFDYTSAPALAERDVELTLLLEEAMHIALPTDHPLAAKPVVRLEELADEDWLSGSCASSCADLVKAACHERGFAPRISFESDDLHVLQGFVARGLGVTLLPDLAMPTLRTDIVVRPVAPVPPMRRVWAATRTEGSRSAATDAMLGVLTEVGEAFSEHHAKLRAVAA
jgi:DNA-binding transcriptional LysR family regulator